MGLMTNDDDFYEDDEPVEAVLAAFNAGEKGLTAPPVPGGGHFLAPISSASYGSVLEFRAGAPVVGTRALTSA
jgi:hypothetical protein